MHPRAMNEAGGLGPHHILGDVSCNLNYNYHFITRKYNILFLAPALSCWKKALQNIFKVRHALRGPKFLR